MIKDAPLLFKEGLGVVRLVFTLSKKYEV